MRWNHRSLLALAPQGLDGAALVAAAGRSGALGILDITNVSDPTVAIREIRRYGDGLVFAVRGRPEQFLEKWFEELTPGLIAAVCVGPSSEEVGRRVRQVAARLDRALMIEALSALELHSALAIGVDGLIVAGNEASGLVGAESSFVLLQAALSKTDRPVWVRGGVGPRVGAAVLAAGAAGVVLEGALLCARESPLPVEIKQQLAGWDGGETSLVEGPGGCWMRVHGSPGSPLLNRLREAGRTGGAAWSVAVAEIVGWGPGRLWPVGQDAAFAGGLAEKYVTVGGIIQAFERSMREGLESASRSRPLAENAPLAKLHGCRLPVVQGPMTRVSDVASFASAVADHGGLPFLAIAMLRGPEARRLLEQTAEELGDRSWGVGLLGFASPELRREQLAEVKTVRPRFALIAGGRPDQAAELERDGIATYLHAPSPGLLEQFLKEGARRFVLEGRECGGHVGPRTSFVLWEQACRVVEQAIEGGVPAESISLVFAGGIHDARSAAAVAALAGDLTAKGLNIGVLMGTAYLFTQEAVESGAVLPGFQAEAVRCRETVLLETGPGHLVRVSPTPFAARFEAERRSLIAQGQSHEQIREALERLNVGRLRVAAKGVDRGSGSESNLVAVSEADQAENGLYMLGQVAPLRSSVVSMAELHYEVATAATAWLQQTASRLRARSRRTEAPEPPSIAVVGMSAILPGARNVAEFWSNSLHGRDSIEEIPSDRWDWRLYYDPDPKAPDKIYSKWGGFVPEVPFDPLRYGMPPSSLPSIEPAQLLALEATRAALADAGYADRPFDRDRTAVVLGMGGGAAQVAMGYAFRSYLPMLDSVAPEAGRTALEQCRGLLPEWTEDSFPGFLLNVTAGRIANRFDLGGANYTVDAACGSSLAALNLAVRELRTNAADMVVLGGVDTVQNPFTYLAFSKTQAFSPTGRCRPFDAGADGIVISEGVAVVVLKRLADAERDGDRVYAVVRGVGSSSDGRCRGLTAPGVEGQMRALERAYEDARIDPASVGYIEAHGTGTAVGDVVELDALTRLFRDAGAGAGACVVGSVKSQIGHTKCAAGLAGLIQASLALHHKVLPPTIGIKRPNPRLDLRDGPFRLNTEALPWLHHEPGRPRRAGVSAFGFGGTNFHAVLEGYETNTAPEERPALRDWPAELFVWTSGSPVELLERLESLTSQLARGARPPLYDLARAVAAQAGPPTGPSLAIVASSHQDLIEKIAAARNAVQIERADLSDPSGVYYSAAPRFVGSRVAFIFPGQGSQSVGMLKDLAIGFDEVRESLEEFDAVLRGLGRAPVGARIFPPPAFDDESRIEQRERLQATDAAQPALGGCSVGVLRLLAALGLEPQLVAGHSYGELVALYAAGALDFAALAELSDGRGRLMRDAGGADPGAMAALIAGPERTVELIGDLAGVSAVNFNGPGQTVIAGGAQAVSRVLERAESRGVQGRMLPVSAAFHTPIMEAASEELTALAARTISAPPTIPVFSNLDSAPHPGNPAEIAQRIGRHLTSPVRFTDMISAMYESGGARVFVEVGPGGVLTPMIGEILTGLPHLAVACDSKGRRGLEGLLHTLARLTVAGVPLHLDRLTLHRASGRLDLDSLPLGDGVESHSASTWMVNGSRSRPVMGPEPVRLGQALVQAVEAGSERGSTSAADSSGSVDDPRRIIPVTNGEPHPDRTTSGGASRNGHGYGGIPADALRPAVQANQVPPQAAERVLAAFQETMRTFLDVQRETMQAYLGGRPGRSTADLDPMIRPADRPNSTTLQIQAGPTQPAQSRIPTVSAKRTPPPIQTPSVESSETRSGPAPVADQSRTVRKAAPAEASGPGAVDRAAIASRLLQIVRDRTGYPADVLRLELDVEADLGIDSIKRVEILGKLRAAFPRLEGFADSASMDRLTRAATLGAIVDQVEKLIGRDGAANDRSATVGERRSIAGSIPKLDLKRDSDSKKRRGPASAILRRTLRAVDAPLDPARAGGLEAGGLVLITEDDRGIAEAVAARIEAKGFRTLLRGGLGREVDWESPAAVDALIAEAQSNGPIAGLVHLSPLRSAAGLRDGANPWTDRAANEARTLFLLARGLVNDLEAAARGGGACLIAATGMGGAFASAGVVPAGFDPGQGAIAGLVKTLAREWEEVRCRVIDLDPSETTSNAAARIAAEALTDDDWSEAGYLDGRRIRLKAVAAPLDSEGGRLEIHQGEPIVIAGGARGITALVAAELARRWRPTLLLIGSTPLPSDVEDAELSGLATAAEVKAILYERASRSGRSPSPGDLENEYQSIIRCREIRRNLEIIRDAGSVVEYAQVDVRDSSNMARVLSDWRSRFGNPVGLIHGAGLIKDKLIRDKSPETFDRVLGTKLDGALNLVGLLDPARLRFIVLFSSIAGRFGNRGQSDYSAANEVLNKFAVWLDRRRTGRVASMIWGPWSGIGMVSELESHLDAQGLGMIPPELGVDALMKELILGRKGDVEVVVSGRLGSLEGPVARAVDSVGSGR